MHTVKVPVQATVVWQALTSVQKKMVSQNSDVARRSQAMWGVYQWHQDKDVLCK